MQRGALNHAHVHGQGCSRRAPPPSLLLSALTPLGATEAAAAAAAAVRHTKKNSKPKRRQRRQQNNFILFSGGRQELSRREEGREGGTWHCNWPAAMEADFAPLQVCTQCSKFRECKQKRPKAQWQLPQRSSLPLPPLSLCLLSSPLAFCL